MVEILVVRVDGETFYACSNCLSVYELPDLARLCEECCCKGLAKPPELTRQVIAVLRAGDKQKIAFKVTRRRVPIHFRLTEHCVTVEECASA